MNAITQKHSKIVKDIALNLGFDFCGISKAQRLEKEEKHLDNWLSNGYHGSMGWMENHFDKRVDPTKLVPGAKSVVSLLFNYFPEENYDDSLIKISKYAYGSDYHYVIKDKMKTFMQLISENIGDVDGRVFVDSAPVLDRAWAAKSGLGWIGKNSLLITKQKGSYYFIAELILDLELVPDQPTSDHCGTCTACIDACPTDAIIADRVVDSTKCISYLTIELRDNIPPSFKGNMEGWAFGCDICQDVCPWNRFASQHQTPDFEIKNELKEMHANEWQELTEEVFKDIFKKSAVKRAGYLKLKENINFCKQ
ncbi:MAG: tRNA epoxyqueuosine(34) reductase QueG [Bacteroidia bacterium]|nr:tRNA epoxyqueuosine(34) reductase QueG [Bacteroidia bacterium]